MRLPASRCAAYENIDGSLRTGLRITSLWAMMTHMPATPKFFGLRHRPMHASSNPSVAQRFHCLHRIPVAFQSRSGRKVESCSVHCVVRAIVHVCSARRWGHFASNWDMVIVKFLSFERNSDGCGWNCIACFNDRLCRPDFRVGIVRGCSVWNQIESNERKLTVAPPGTKMIS